MTQIKNSSNIGDILVEDIFYKEPDLSIWVGQFIEYQQLCVNILVSSFKLAKLAYLCLIIDHDES